jgi:hypothetical protein
MPFGHRFDRYYRNIFAPAVLKADLHPVRGDSLFRSSPIMEDIWKLVNEATVLLADLSGRNRNVFYELDLAHALAKPVVLVSTSLDDVPFDIRGLRVHTDDKYDEAWGTHLQASIVQALHEALTDVRSAIPPMFLTVKKAKRPAEEATQQLLRGVLEEIGALRGERAALVSRAQTFPPAHKGKRRRTAVLGRHSARLPVARKRSIRTASSWPPLHNSTQAAHLSNHRPR